jgi:hypothetical protein
VSIVPALAALGVLFFFLVALERFLEILDSFADSFSHFGQPLGAEQEKYNNKKKQKFCWT